MLPPLRLLYRLSLLLLAVAAADSAISLCSQKACGCEAPTSRAAGTSSTKVVDGATCICFCGTEIGSSCTTDGQCVHGAKCKFDYSSTDSAVTGKCTSLCEFANCPQFHNCKLNSAGAPVCSCATYNCEHSVLVPVCATSSDDKTIRRFNNTCQFVNANCNRVAKGQPAMRSFACVGSS